MLTDHVPFQLRRGGHTLTVSALNDGFAGFINGQFYIVAHTPDAVVRHFISGPRHNQPVTNKADPSKLVQAAKDAVGDSDEDAAPLEKDEAKAMAEVKRQASHPSKADVKKTATKLLDQS